jgi:TolA-binding protein
MAAYDKLLTQFPKSNVVPTAYLQKGMALEKKGATSEAIAVYDTVVRKYPKRPEAQTAQSRMNALKSESSGARETPAAPSDGR